MRKLATLTAAAALVAAFGLLYPTPASAGVFDDLVSYWPFDDDSADPTLDAADGNDGDLTCQGGGALNPPTREAVPMPRLCPATSMR